MKKVLSIFTLLLCISFFANAQDTPATVAPAEEATTPQDGPKIVFETDVIDYGTIEQDSDPYRFFKFTNTGNEALVITHAKGSCGCTVPTYPTEPIMPGESGEIKVRYATNRVGPFTKRVTLTTNASEEKIVLTIKGKVLKKEEAPEGVPAKQNGLFKN